MRFGIALILFGAILTSISNTLHIRNDHKHPRVVCIDREIDACSIVYEGKQYAFAVKMIEDFNEGEAR